MSIFSIYNPARDLKCAKFWAFPGEVNKANPLIPVTTTLQNDLISHVIGKGHMFGIINNSRLDIWVKKSSFSYEF